MSKIVLITGANKGLGLETARQLGREYGFTLLLGARNEENGWQAASELTSEGLEAHFVKLDVTNSDLIQEAFNRVQSEFGALDVLINNAGIMLEHNARVTDLPLDTWRESFEVNLFGVVAVTQAFLPLLRQSSAGRIVNLSATLASMTEMSKPQMAQWIRGSYTASKAALNAYTVALAQELRQTNIKVNAAHPGWVQTDMGGAQAPMKVTQGVRTSVMLATLPDDGPTGGFFHMGKPVAW